MSHDIQANLQNIHALTLHLYFLTETFRGSKEEQVANLDFFSLYKNIIAIPSISSTDPRWDQSNEAVIRLLADWFGQLGFQCEVTALPDLPGKFNLVATRGQGEGGLAAGRPHGYCTVR